MSYYRYNKKQLEEIKKINTKISKEQQQIFDILLKISQSFSDENFSKEKRNELFSKVDSLKQNIKDYNEKIKDIKAEESYENIENNTENNIENSVSKKDIKLEEQVEKKNEEFVNTVQKLEDTLKESESIKEKNEKMQEKEEVIISKRKKARTQLIVVEDDDSLSGKIKDFFNKLRSIIKK